MTISTAEVPRRSAIDGKEGPPVPPLVERQREDTVCVVDAHLAIRQDSRELVELRAPRADGELPNATSLVGVSFGVLRCEPLVQVIVRRDDDIDALRIQNVPELLHLVLASVSPRAEARMMEVRDGAPIRSEERRVG